MTSLNSLSLLGALQVRCGPSLEFPPYWILIPYSMRKFFYILIILHTPYTLGTEVSLLCNLQIDAPSPKKVFSSFRGRMLLG